MNITSDKPYMVFAKEYQGKTYYKVGISKKDKEGRYENGYIDIHFRNNIKIENKTQIYLRNAFLTFYLSKDNHTIPYIQVMEFETVGETIEQSSMDSQLISAINMIKTQH